uniref:RNA-dependent RNA polymerase n=1 Tax=Caloscypha fulgens mycovirus 1 TaxID=2778769 RepID=A0A7L8Y960_9VIRU|nr:RNA-dependent RNA polymerase [Caloscypha fulgens mycovirus 1]
MSFELTSDGMSDNSMRSASAEPPYHATNLMVVGGVLRIRKFNISYMDGPLIDADDVIAELPRVITAPRASLNGADTKGHQTNSDGVRTEETNESVRSDGRSRTQRRNDTRRHAKLVKRHSTSTSASNKLQEGFKFIDVHTSPVRLGKFSKELRFAKPDPAVLEYVMEGGGGVEGFDPSKHCFMESCGDVQMAHLKMYDNQTEIGPRFDELENPEKGRWALEQAIDWVQDALQLPNLLPCIDDFSMEDVNFDPDKSAGVYYRLQGFRKRGEVAPIARAEAVNATIRLLMGEIVPHRCTRIGGRGKPISMSEKEAIAQGLKKGRAIHMTDTRDHFILGLTEQPLNDAWKQPKFPISVGRGWFHGDASEFVARHSTVGEHYCFDAEKFDSSLMSWLIHIAISIMRFQFVEGHSHKYDNYWHFVEESLLHSFVFRDDGFIFEKYNGTSSGHNHNSLAQSICTLIMAAFGVFYENHDLTIETIRRNFSAEALGDDNYTSQSNVLRATSVDERGLRVWKVFRVSWLGSKSFSTQVLCEGAIGDDNWDEDSMYGSVQYLGKYFRSLWFRDLEAKERRVAIPHRPLIETIVRLLYPEGVSMLKEDEAWEDMNGDNRGARVGGHMLDGFGNPNTRRWLDGLVFFCNAAGYSCELSGAERMRKRFERMRVDFPQEELDFSEFTYQRWLQIVIWDKEGELRSIEQVP